MSKVLLFIYDDMADFEITFISHLLGADSGREIIPIAYEDKLIKSKANVIYKPMKLVKEVLTEDAEALLIPGGFNGETRPELMELIKILNDKGALIGAICAGPRFLAKAGILDNVKYTTSIVSWTEDHVQRFKENDPFPRQNFILDRVVRDKNIITAQGYAFVDFAIEICDYLGLFENEEDRIGFEKLTKGI